MTKRGYYNAGEVFTAYTCLVVVGSMGYSHRVHVRKGSVRVLSAWMKFKSVS